MAVLSVAAFLLYAIALADWVPLLAALLCLAVGVFIWRTRNAWRFNADRWRRGDDAF